MTVSRSSFTVMPGKQPAGAPVLPTRRDVVRGLGAVAAISAIGVKGAGAAGAFADGMVRTGFRSFRSGAPVATLVPGRYRVIWPYIPEVAMPVSVADRVVAASPARELTPAKKRALEQWEEFPDGTRYLPTFVCQWRRLVVTGRQLILDAAPPVGWAGLYTATGFSARRLRISVSKHDDLHWAVRAFNVVALDQLPQQHRHAGARPIHIDGGFRCFVYSRPDLLDAIGLRETLASANLVIATILSGRKAGHLSDPQVHAFLEALDKTLADHARKLVFHGSFQSRDLGPDECRFVLFTNAGVARRYRNRPS